MRCRHLIFSAKSKKEDTIYMEIIFMSFLQRNLLCKNIYTMLSFMWSNELFSILKWWLYLYCILCLVFRYLKSVKKNFRRKCGIYFCDWLSNRILRKSFLQLAHPNHILRIKFLWFRAKIAKISSAIIYFPTIYNHKNFCP